MDISRRLLLKGFPVAAAATVVTPALAQNSDLVPLDMTLKVVSWILEGGAPKLLRLTPKIDESLQSEPRDIESVLTMLSHASRFSYEAKSVSASKIRNDITLADLLAPEWASLEAKILPKIKPKANIDIFQQSRVAFVQEVMLAARLAGRGEDTSWFEAATAQCTSQYEKFAERVRRQVSASYRAAPLAFMERFHERGTNFGLIVFQEKRDKREELIKLLPTEVVEHSQATFYLSGWGRSYATEILPVAKSLIVLPDNQGWLLPGNLEYAVKTLLLILGDVAHTLALKETRHGVLLDAQAMLPHSREQLESVSAIPDMEYGVSPLRPFDKRAKSKVRAARTATKA